MKKFSPNTTLEEIKHFLKENWLKGEECPACHQFVKMYKRKLTSGMAKALIQLYKLQGGQMNGYIHISKLGRLNGGEFAQLKHWGLIEEEMNDDTAKRTSGNWTVTYRGGEFVRNEREVSSHIYTYNMELKALSPEQTSIVKALGKNFNYEELMANVS